MSEKESLDTDAANIAQCIAILRDEFSDRQALREALFMSLRDYFAGQALRGINIEEQADLAYAAEEAYGIADAMLPERDK